VRERDNEGGREGGRERGREREIERERERERRREDGMGNCEKGNKRNGKIAKENTQKFNQEI
jgi:hypothetical protein